MNLTRTSLKNPAATLVVVILLLVFGLMAIKALPIQLLPDIERPQITINNGWRAAAPEEMESTIVEPQEAVLRQLRGLTEMSSNVGPGFGNISLTFEVGQDMQMAMLDVINALNQTPPRPRESMEPVVTLGGGRGNVASILLKKLDKTADSDFTSHQKLIDDVVEPGLKAIPGVSIVDLASYRPKELHIVFDPYRMAALGLDIDSLQQRLRRSGNTSGGFAEVGRRQYTVRFQGQYTPEDYGQMIVSYNQGRPVYLNEVADVSVGYSDISGFTSRNGYPAYYITVQRTLDSNTVAILEGINKTIERLNQGELARAGLELELSFDASIHIKRAIALVNGNLALGIGLALLILYLFLRGVVPTLLIAVTIPVSLLLAFIVLEAFERSLNVVSLAGLAFAVGLVLDAAIIVQENIVRLLQKGHSLAQAVKQGTGQVSGALVASTATTVAIFLPVLFMEGVEGQLFYDLAMTLAVAVVASMLTALTIIPVASQRWIKVPDNDDQQDTNKNRLWIRLSDLIQRLTGGRRKPLLWATVLVPGMIAVIVLLMPKTDFLPQAKSDGIFSGFTLPPGGNIQVLKKEIGDLLIKRLTPYYEDKKYPAIKGYNIAMYPSFNVLFIYPENPKEIPDVLKLLKDEILVGLPDTRSFSVRGSLLNFGLNTGREVYLDFQGPDTAELMAQAKATRSKVEEALSGAGVRALPGLSFGQPELRVLPDDIRLASAGVDRQTVANAVRAVTDGVYVGEYFDGNDRMDIILRSQGWRTPEQLEATPLYTQQGGVQTLGQLTQMERTVGPTSLLRIDGQRTISLQISPPDNMALVEVMDILEQQVLSPLRPDLPKNMSVRFRESGNNLNAAIVEMSKNFLIAVLILFLLMAALFKSAKDSLLVMLSMPLAIAGGVVSLRLLNLFTFQSLDLLTMIGFIILMGLVVNNAILMVDQTRRGQALGWSLDKSVYEAVLTRSRPVYMSTLTSIFGMLPLMLVPGVGSEIYRGLATVIVGGMAFSALFTLLLMPSLLRLTGREPIEPVVESTPVAAK